MSVPDPHPGPTCVTSAPAQSFRSPLNSATVAAIESPTGPLYPKFDWVGVTIPALRIDARPMARPIDVAPPAAGVPTARLEPGGLARKADLCARILRDAQRLVRTGQRGAPVRPLVARASELLDDMDEMLLVHQAAGGSDDAAIAVTLRRALAHIEEAAGAQGWPPAPPTDPDGNR